ncbi:MAG: GDP-L-fucose synthase [Flavobacteriales bacterium]|nr:GDP-L-fucose synthase [Flavobacteriales bacterium]
MKIYVAGHRGMAGSATVRSLKKSGYSEIITATRSELDLMNQAKVKTFVAEQKPDVIIIAAARVGGILANNDFPYEFLMENLIIETNLIQAAVENNIEKVIFLGSSCIYPKFAEQPIREDSLLTGPLEPTNEWYAIAKIAGVKLCQSLRKEYGKNYFSLMPTNLYGPFDNFDLKTSHVLPAMIRKFHDAKLNGNTPVTLWGSGTPLREFLHVDDLADAIVFAMQAEYLDDYLYNVGFGSDLTIKELAETIQKTVGHEGEIVWDSTKPDGTPKKLMDSSKFRSLGWSPKIGLEEGIESTYKWFLENGSSLKLEA